MQKRFAFYSKLLASLKIRKITFQARYFLQPPNIFFFFYLSLIPQWKRINRKQSARWQHLSQLKASAFFSLQKISQQYEMQQPILGISYTIQWMMEPYTVRNFLQHCVSSFLSNGCHKHSYILNLLLASPEIRQIFLGCISSKTFLSPAIIFLFFISQQIKK